MAESKDLSARLRFLHESAHLLASSSPETSSFLEARYSHLLTENGLKTPETRKREVCGACGLIFVPGSSSEVTQERERTVVYSCLRCHSKTRLRGHNPLKISAREKPTQVAASKADNPAPPVPPISGSANVSSKKRAKARKGGLAAILASSKKPESTASKGFGLDLMDFMQGS